jgi:hypothetical protein
MSRLFDQTLDVIEGAFQARKIFVAKGALVDVGPDHCARIEAARLAARCSCGQRGRRPDRNAYRVLLSTQEWETEV